MQKLRKKNCFILLEADYDPKELIKTLEDTVKSNEEELKKLPKESDELEANIIELSKANELEISQIKSQIPVSKSNPEQIRILTMKLNALQEKKKNLDGELKKIQERERQKSEQLKNTILKTQESIKTIKAQIEMQDKAEEMTSQKKVTESEDSREEIIIRRNFARLNEQEAQAQSKTSSKPKKQPVIVNFDKSTDNPFQVTFTERGFLIGDTRLSFELLEVAINKEFNIVLENGTGLTLDAVRMQKILKYKDRV